MSLRRERRLIPPPAFGVDARSQLLVFGGQFAVGVGEEAVAFKSLVREDGNSSAGRG